jgi:hypothetical protein
MNNFLLFLGSLVVVVLAALAGIPYLVDWNGYRGVLEEEASRVLGRDVRVAGNVGLRFLPSPYVHFEKLRIGSGPGEETGQPFFRAEGFTMWLSVPPLLKGIVQARDIELRQPEMQITIDGEGLTSLSSLSIRPGALPFVPNEVALQSVRILDGRLGVWGAGPDGRELVRLQGIAGELSADSLKGPYRFRGTLDWADTPREVRISTSSQDANGDLRVKVIVTAPHSSNSYTVEGTAADLAGRVRFAGKLTARVSTQTIEVGEAPSQPPAAPATTAQKAFFDVASNLKIHGGALHLDDLAISLEQGSLPQLVAGRARFNWAEPQQLDIALHSKWLDLDALTAGQAASSAAVPLEVARTLFDRLVDVLPDSMQTHIAIELDQVGLGRQNVSNVRFETVRADGALTLRDVRANLPGGTELSLEGTVEGDGNDRAFAGMLAMSGQSLARFSAWGFGDNPFAHAGSDGPFSLTGALQLSDQAIAFTEAEAELNGTPLQGQLRLGLEGPRRIAIALEGHRIDLAQLWPDNPGLPALRKHLLAQPWGSSSSTQQDNAGSGYFAREPDVAPDLTVNIKAGTLIDGRRQLDNLHVDLSVSGGLIDIPSLKFQSAGGLDVDVKGTARRTDGAVQGKLKGVISAPTPQAATTLAELLDVPSDHMPVVERWGKLTPWRLATTLTVGERTPEALDLDVDGTVLGGHAVGLVRLNSTNGKWINNLADGMLTIEAPEFQQLLNAVSPAQANAPALSQSDGPGRLFIKAVGPAGDGLVTLAEMNADGIDLAFSGRVNELENSGLTARGDIRVAARDVRNVLALAGVPLAPGASDLSVAGTIAAAKEAGRIVLAAPSIQLGSATVSGVATLTPQDGGALTGIDVELAADRASLPGLLLAVSAAPVASPQGSVPDSTTASERDNTRRSSRAPSAADVPNVNAQAPRSIWPDQPFDLAPLDRVAGKVRASIRNLELEPGVAIKDARMEIALRPGSMEVAKLEGGALGGKATADFVLKKLAAGVGADGKLAIQITSTGSSENDGDDSLLADVASINLSFSGQALSADSLISALAGEGELKIGDVTLHGVAPKAVSDVSEKALQGAGPMAGAGLADALRAALKEYALKIGEVVVPIKLSDGMLKLARVELASPDGRAVFDATVDLRRLLVASTWNIEGKAMTRAAPSVAAAAGITDGVVPAPVAVERRTLPPVTLNFSGRLADLMTMEPVLAADALERELAVRRMERDVDELERLRRLDEQRAAQERARRAAEEAERKRRLEEQRLRETVPDASVPQDTPPLPSAPGAASQVVPGGPQGSGEGQSVGGDGAATSRSTVGEGMAAGADDGGATPPPANTAPRPPRLANPPVQKKKPVQNTWQPFQITPYQ